MDVGILKFYEEGTSLRGNSPWLQQLISRWDHGCHAFRVGPDLWYHTKEEDVYFIIGLSMKGDVWPQFLDLLHGFVGETKLAYVQIYVSPNVLFALGF